MESGDPWVIRQYDPARDESGVLYLWLKSAAHGSFGRGLGAQIDGSDAERAYWAQHKAVVLRLLERADTKVLVDREADGVIWAFVCTEVQDPPYAEELVQVYHYGVIKRKFKEFTDEMFRALLGDMLDKPAVYTHDPSGTGLRAPAKWTYNPYAVMGAS